MTDVTTPAPEAGAATENVPIHDPVLAAHIAARDAEVSAHLGQGAAHYLGVLQDRANRFAAHVGFMVLDPVAIQWAVAMRRQFGPYVRVHWYIADWITALLILRYGEEPEINRSTDPNFLGWPLMLTADDLHRASELLRGERWPAQALRLLPADPLAVRDGAPDAGAADSPTTEG